LEDLDEFLGQTCERMKLAGQGASSRQSKVDFHPFLCGFLKEVLPLFQGSPDDLLGLA
jgi:hypothetical protein